MNAIKRTVLGALALMLMTGAAMAADPAMGVWKTEVDDGAYAYVRILPCEDRICGVITRTFKSSGEYKSANIGKALVWNMQARGDGAYGGGKIWQPSTDRIYSSKMVLDGDTLKVSGCFGPICKKQTWRRVK